MSDTGSPVAGVHLRRLADRVRQATLHVVWRQWRALGAGATTPGASRALRSQIDPEALVLVSFVLMESERRLADLLHDWAAVNSTLLSVQRMRNLAREYTDANDRAVAIHLAWFAGIARDHGKDLRWRPVAESWPTGEARPRDPRARRDEKHRAGPPRLRAPAALPLRLRLGLGVGVKADILSYLLGTGSDWSSIRDIVRATSYTSAAVRRAVVDLATARFVLDREGSPVRYRADRARWAGLLAIDEEIPAWSDWRAKFLFVTALLRWATTAAERPLTEYVYGVRARELLEQHRDAFERDGIATWSESTPVADWSRFATEAIESLADWMTQSA